MSDIIKITGVTVETLFTEVDHYEALQYIRDNYPRCTGKAARLIEGITIDGIFPIDDSQDYIGKEGGSIILVAPESKTYQDNQYLQLLLKDGSTMDLYDKGWCRIYGSLQDDRG